MTLGIIGGSGLYDLDDLGHAEWRPVTTPFGEPSDDLLFAEVDGTEIVFLPRHRRGHCLLPHEINYRANIAALKLAGCTEILSVAACGSFREELAPGAFVLVDQYVDRTRDRVRTFFGDGIAAHVSLADPSCKRLRGRVADAAASEGVDVQNGGTYLAMEGPAFSSRAESRLYRQAGLDVIGMTAMPEAALAREAELCYATLAMVTDWDSWRDAAAGAAVTDILAVMHENVAHARRIVMRLAGSWKASGEACEAGCDHALDHAIITPKELWPQMTADRLRSIAGRVL
ncbi:methylthioadenosine phosphorylase [Pacificimonas flava]|uniref:S-methyl-5'-thioadenosine phosphorylase n=2 Tax=Pacificimonas TaxID=1960290 RepID=A0A219B4M4_9SPHN|nr:MULTISPECIES: S-methyl-5'-thioadenosine phosphorylase [Pacificimonas]MBZ6377224.1 S-methyl-5'-thioadenosine phosphorylase [Pacificimonas aurantium]OWV33056.1 methylthioadenosine phosphorylase [Pacificimonas flava]